MQSHNSFAALETNLGSEPSVLELMRRVQRLETENAKIKIIISAILKTSNIISPQMFEVLQRFYTQEEIEILNIAPNNSQSDMQKFSDESEA